MKNRTGMTTFWLSALFILLTQTSLAGEEGKVNVISSARGTRVVSVSSYYSQEWSAENLMDAKNETGWCCQKGSIFPHVIVFELVEKAEINLLKFNNQTEESGYPGISAKEVVIEFSTEGPDRGYRQVASLKLIQGASTEEYSISQNEAKWIRLSINSNYGQSSYTELMEFEAWGRSRSKLLIFPDGRGSEILFPQGKVSFADKVICYDPGAPGEGTGGEPKNEVQNAEEALGIPDYDEQEDKGYVSLGRGGTLTIQFTDNVLTDTEGDDLFIFEIGPDVEDTFVEISKDGKEFIEVGKVSGSTAALDISPYARAGENFAYVRLVDDPDEGERSGPTVGADIDAIGAISSAIKIEIPSEVLFDFDKHDIRSDAVKILQEVAEKIREYADSVVSVEGHTDSVGSDKYNLMLSQKRADSVKEYLIRVQGLKDVEFETRGWGESGPIASNQTEEGRQKNRRVEIIIKVKR